MTRSTAAKLVVPDYQAYLRSDGEGTGRLF
jgi:hypothetical protein